MEFGLKWVHMARYELILKLDGALWLTIISKKNHDPKKGHGRTNNASVVQRARHYENPLCKQKAHAHMELASKLVFEGFMVSAQRDGEPWTST